MILLKKHVALKKAKVIIWKKTYKFKAISKVSLLLFKCASLKVLRDKRMLGLNVPPQFPRSSVDPFIHNRTLFLEVCAFTAHEWFISLTSTEGLRLCADILHKAMDSFTAEFSVWSGFMGGLST